MKRDGEIQIIPTCIPQNAEDLQAKILQVKAFSNAIHIDIDDGVFTPEISWPFQKNVSKAGNKKGSVGKMDTLDIHVVKTVDNFFMQIHLMVSDGREAGEKFIKAGAQSIILHVESAITPFAAFTDTLGAWSMLGVEEIGIALLLDTPLEKLDPLLPFCDFIHVLSVASIGAQGAMFDPRAIDRVKEIRDRFPSHAISVDGGISLDNIADLVKAGATRFAVGSAIVKASDPAKTYRELKAIAQKAQET